VRSYLYVPGSRPDRFDKAAAGGADAIILDLEDAVAPTDKVAARAAVVAWLHDRTGGVPAVVRVNSGELLSEDVRAVAAARPFAISVPKVSSAADIEGVAGLLAGNEIPLIALIETAAGVLDARAIAEHPLVARLAIGEADLGAELGIEPSEDGREFWPMRGLVILASAAAGIDPPVGPVFTDIGDLGGLRASTDDLRRRGFGARAAIHPAQVAVINETFTPTAEVVAAARALLDRFEASGGGVFADDDGRMVDEAVVRAARRTLEHAGD